MCGPSVSMAFDLLLLVSSLCCILKSVMSLFSYAGSKGCILVLEGFILLWSASLIMTRENKKSKFLKRIYIIPKIIKQKEQVDSILVSVYGNFF
jgi:hypothetical protein